MGGKGDPYQRTREEDTGDGTADDEVGDVAACVGVEVEVADAGAAVAAAGDDEGVECDVHGEEEEEEAAAGRTGAEVAKHTESAHDGRMDGATGGGHAADGHAVAAGENGAASAAVIGKALTGSPGAGGYSEPCEERAAVGRAGKPRSLPGAVARPS